VVEGEKCADALQEFFDEFINAKTTRKSVATTLGSSKNAKRWPEYAPRLSDKEIVVFADLDEPGEEAAQAAAKAFANVGASVDVVSFTRGENADGEPVDFERPNGEGAPPPTYDVADYLDDLRAETATLEPEKARAIRWSKFLNLLKTFSRPPKAVLPALPREFGFSVPVGRDVRAQQVDNDKFAPPSTTAPEPGTFGGRVPGSDSGDASSPLQEENRDDENPVERRKRRDAAARERRIEREIEEEAAPFPLDTLPRVLREYVEELARRLQCDPGPLALACLSVAGCVAGFRYRLYAPELIVGKQIRPPLSAMLVGTPGAGKTPITGAALAPLEEIDKEAIEKYNERPKGKRGLFVSHMMRDATPQAFQRRLIDLRNQGVQNGVLLYLQEGAKALNFDSRGNGAAATNSILIETLGGGQQRIDRVKDGDEALVADAVCCAVLAEIQPDPLRRAIQRDSSFADQGLAYRFLWAYVPDRPLAIEVAAPDETTRIAYVALIRWLDELFPEDEAEPGLTLVLSPEALDATKRFRA
ncbi:MAG: DUF3987 domain-containing protein, partial [Thermoguttaceae bacterium]|nr:DUF3987 domain-containing protein [Thermoguttaceae bacterium]